MKLTAVFDILCCLPLALQAEVSPELLNGYRNGAESKVVYRVVDDEGNAVSNATAEIWYRSYGRPQDNAHWKTQTNRDGEFVAQHRTNERLSVAVRKDGYYSCRDVVSYFDIKKNSVVDGRWQPFGEKRTLVMKRMLKPVRLDFHDGLDYKKVPEYGVWLGFDLQLFDFTSPYGRGRSDDVLLLFTLIKGKDYLATIEMSFTNNVQAGCYRLKKDMYSGLKTVYRADPFAHYEDSVKFSYVRKFGNPPVSESLGEDEYLVFRTRTKVDEDGNLILAHYGIIEGPLSFVGPGGLSVDCCLFNPVEKDTNLEVMRK